MPLSVSFHICLYFYLYLYCIYAYIFTYIYVCTCTYIGRNKVSSQLPIPSCGGHGVPASALYVAWLAEELIHGNKIILLSCSGP